MIEVRQVGKIFPSKKRRGTKGAATGEKDPRDEGSSFRALQEITFLAHSGEITGLLGSNGAGKTTLLRILATSLKPTSGSAAIDGIDVVSDSSEVRRRVGFLSGNTGLYERLTARELLTFFGRMYGISATTLGQRVETLCEELQLSQFADRCCNELSSGMKQRVSIARALIHSPSVIIFDEPTTGLDVSSAHGILSYIEQCRDAGRTILFSTHHMHEVDKLCDRVVIMRHGRTCFEGTVEQMREASGHDDLDYAYLALSGEGGVRSSVVSRFVARRRGSRVD